MCTTTPGIRSYSELRNGGRTRSDIDALLASGTIERLRIGVYAHVGACGDVRTAAMHGGPPACVTAARHLGLWTLGDDADPVHVWLRGHGRPRSHTDCDCVGHWDKDAAANAFGLPSVPRVLLQILACRGVEEFFVALESALRKSRLSSKDLRWLRSRVTRAGREAMDFARRTSDSGLESLLRWRLRALGIEVRSQVKIPSVGTVDALIGERLIIEADGKENHDDDPHRHKDLVRDANAAAWGYVTLRFDYAMIVHDWETVELAILSAVDRGLHLVR